MKFIHSALRHAAGVLLAAAAMLIPCPGTGQTHFTVLAPDGAWTWYNDPRALFHNGTLYFGYVRHSDGRTVLSAFDPRTAATTNLWTSTLTERDDHNVPGLLVREDGRMLAMYARHNTDLFFNYRLSTTDSPDTPAEWGPELRSADTAARMTYANPVQLRGESNLIYNFARNLNFNPTVFTSRDGGATWSEPQIYLRSGTGSVRPYVKIASDGQRRIDFLYTDGHPRDVTNSLYHLYYEGGTFRKTDGTVVGRFADIPLQLDKGASGSVIYQYSTEPQSDPNQWIPRGRAWCWEIVNGSNGPVCVFTVRLQGVGGPNWDGNRIYYYYARWTGTEWQKRFIAHAGRPLYDREGDYAGGICIDPEDPNVVYISSNARDPFALESMPASDLAPDERYELWRGVTSDGGLSFKWQPVTTNSSVDNLRPYVPRGHHGRPALIWFRGHYRAYTAFQTEVAGLFSTKLPAHSSAGTGTLTNAAQIRALTLEQAASQLPVRLKGIIVSEAEPDGQGLVILDDTAGIYLAGPPDQVSGTRRGDVVEVFGYTDPGEFAPFVRMTTLRRVGSAPVPHPRAISYEDLITGRPDAQWVQVSGIVRKAEPRGAGQRRRLELASGGGRLTVQVNGPLPVEDLVDAVVTVQGVCFYQVNRSRQVISPLIHVPRGVPISVDLAGPVRPYSTPTRTIGSLLQFAPQGSYGHRVHVRGVITHQDRDRGLVWLRDDTGGLCVHSDQSATFKPGDVVDVLGFPNRGDYSPVLEDAVLTKSADGPPPIPAVLSDTTSALDWDAGLVELNAELLNRQSTADGWLLGLRGKPGDFRALLRLPPSGEPPPEWAPGAQVRVRGICSLIPDNGRPVAGRSEPRSFEILLRSAEDLAVIHPAPWWNGERAIRVLAVVVGVLSLAVACVVWNARKRAREHAVERLRAEAEFSAILSERNRMAREIHDTLAQGLGAISMQLELVKGALPAQTNGAAAHVEQAHRLVRESLADARNSIWNMRSQVLETGDLASALKGILETATDGTPVRARFHLKGAARRLSPVTENNLLRIGQEAIVNAVKHAAATRIDFHIQFTPNAVLLRIHDNGKGFDPAAAHSRAGSFGLVGMRERASELQADLQVQSTPGHGTQIDLKVPLSFDARLN